jgi:hypothetical protein
MVTKDKDSACQHCMFSQILNIVWSSISTYSACCHNVYSSLTEIFSSSTADGWIKAAKNLQGKKKRDLKLELYSCSHDIYAFLNDGVLDRATAANIEIMLIRDRLTKALLYGELADVSRRIGRPSLSWDLETPWRHVEGWGVLHSWRNIVAERPAWRRLILAVCNKTMTDAITTGRRGRSVMRER